MERTNQTPGFDSREAEAEPEAMRRANRREVKASGAYGIPQALPGRRRREAMERANQTPAFDRRNQTPAVDRREAEAMQRANKRSEDGKDGRRATRGIGRRAEGSGGNDGVVLEMEMVGGGVFDVYVPRLFVALLPSPLHIRLVEPPFPSPRFLRPQPFVVSPFPEEFRSPHVPSIPTPILFHLGDEALAFHFVHHSCRSASSISGTGFQDPSLSFQF